MSTTPLQQDIFDYLIEQKSVSTSELVRGYQARGFTKQGVYKVLRQLRTDGKIVWHQMRVEPNLVWLYREIDRLSSVFPDQQRIFDDLAKKQTYKIKTLAELDDLWGQLFVKILASLPAGPQNFLFYDLHNYTYVHKIPTVDWYVNFLFKKHGEIFLLVGSESSLDRALVANMPAVRTHCIPKKWDTFISVLGDFVVYNHIDVAVRKRMDHIFSELCEAEAKVAIEKLASQLGTFKIVVEKNHQKVQAIEKEFRKYFLLDEARSKHKSN